MQLKYRKQYIKVWNYKFDYMYKNRNLGGTICIGMRKEKVK